MYRGCDMERIGLAMTSYGFAALTSKEPKVDNGFFPGDGLNPVPSIDVRL